MVCRVLLFATTLFLASGRFASANVDGDASKEIERVIGQMVFFTHPVVNVTLGNHAGRLYTFKYGNTAAFNSWFMSGGHRIVIVNQSQFDDDVQAHDVVSIFVVKVRASSCLAYLKINYLWQPGISDRREHYDGDVYCMKGNTVVRNPKLSRALDGKRTAGEARNALAPFL